MIKVVIVLVGLVAFFVFRPKPAHVKLVPPGVNVIEYYGRQKPQNRGCAPLVGPLVIIVLVGAGLFVAQRATATPEQMPIPTVADIPTSTITPTVTNTPTGTATNYPTFTPRPTNQPTSTPTITPTYTPNHTPSATLRPFIVGQVIDANELNVRYGPSVEHAAFDRLNRDDQVQLVGRDNGARWGCFYVDGGLGWVSMAYVWTDENIARLPVMEAPPANRIG